MQTIERTLIEGGFPAAFAAARDIASDITRNGGTVMNVNTYNVTGAILIVVGYREGEASASD